MRPSDRPWSLPACVAHRGGGSTAPENTLPAIAAGAGRGFRAVEFDVQLSADGVPVLFHDDTLERTSDGHGRVIDHPWSTLAQLDAGRWFAPRFAGTPVPRLDQALAACAALGLQAVVELKVGPGQDPERLGAVVADAVAATAVPALLISFSLPALRAAHGVRPEQARALLLDREWPADWRVRAAACGACAIDADHASLTPERIAAVRGAGLRLVVWTLDDPLRARELRAAGVDAVTTDALDAMLP